MTIAAVIKLDPMPPAAWAAWLAALLTPAPALQAEADAFPEQRLDLADLDEIQQGNGECFRRIIERHQSQISTMMWRFTRHPDEHQELVQDVFVEAYLSLRTYRRQAPFAHWLARIATRTGYKYWQRQTRERQRVPLEIEGLTGVLADQSGSVEPELAAETVYCLLRQLPPRDRLILTLRYLEGLSVEEAAARTGWSVPLVKMQASRARQKLAKLMDRVI